jgi:methyl-accepting chemotaxis protein
VAILVFARAPSGEQFDSGLQLMIERLQIGVQNAVKATHSGSSKARQSVEQAAGVDQALTDTSDSVRRINDMTAQIATACEEQSSVTEEIARNISDIRDLSNEAAQTSELSAQASQRLSELSHGLSALVGRFRV